MLKSVISEIIEDNEDLVRRVFEEAFEDAFMKKAIRDGRETKRVSRSAILNTLSELER